LIHMAYGRKRTPFGKAEKERIQYDYWRLSTVILNYLAVLIFLGAIAIGTSDMVGLALLVIATIAAWAAVVIAYISISKGSNLQRAKLSIIFSTVEAVVITIILAMVPFA
jgi:hypothetical protein